MTDYFPLCDLYRHPQRSLIIEAHHVVPKSWFLAAGVLVDTPMISLCPTCHMNVHCCIDHLINGEGRPLFAPRRAFDLAHQAMLLAKGKGLTPRRTL